MPRFSRQRLGSCPSSVVCSRNAAFRRRGYYCFDTLPSLMATSGQRFISLFSGCGGFDLGYLARGYRPTGAFDLDPAAVTTFRRNLGTHVSLADLRAGLGDSRGFNAVDVLIAGPPCQGFSTAGQRRVDDERNSLLTLTGILARRLRPKVVVVENVTGALAGDHARYWHDVSTMLRATGYRTHSVTLSATRVGMAQIRKRIFLFAWRSGRDALFPLPHCAPATLAEVLCGVSGLQNHKTERLRRGTDLWRIAARIGQGQKLSNVRGGPRAVHTWDIPEVFGTTTEDERTMLELLLRLRRQDRRRRQGDADPVSIERLSHAFGGPFRRLLGSLVRKGFVCYKGNSLDLVHTFNGKFRRLEWECASLTVDTRFGDPRYFLHPTDPRGFTVREAARIQGFPDTFIFEGDTKAQYRLIGNAVPPPMAALTAKFASELIRAA